MREQNPGRFTRTRHRRLALCGRLPALAAGLLLVWMTDRSFATAPLSATSPSLTFTVAPGAVTTQVLTLTNAGATPTTWTLRERLVATTATAASLAAPVIVDWNAPRAPGQLIVGFRKSVASANELSVRDAVHATLGARRTRSFRHASADVVEVPESANLHAVAKRYAQSPDVAYVEPNYAWRAETTPNDPLFSELWAMRNTGQSGGLPGADIDATQAWTHQRGQPHVVVAVIDSGVDLTHEDLVDNLWANEAERDGLAGVDDDANGVTDDIHGAEWVGGAGVATSGNPDDDYGHGTHVAGTIAAVGDNGVGGAGVCWNARIMALRFIDASGVGYTADAVAAIEYAIDMGADISNASWGGGPDSQVLRDAIDAAGSAGQLFVASAGNEGRDTDTTPHYPSGYDLDNIISVAASDPGDARLPASNWGVTTVDLAAPGATILSCSPDDSYTFRSGTSMAAAHVAGVAALLLSQAPDSAPANVKQWLLDGVDAAPAWTGLTISEGRLNAARALAAADVLWLHESPTSGTLATSESINLTVVADALGLDDGYQAAAELLFDAGGAIEALIVPVTIDVVEHVSIDHAPLGDTNDTDGPYLVDATVTAAATLITTGVRLFHRVNDNAFSEVVMTTTGATLYTASIPGQPHGVRVDYYLRAGDEAGNVAYSPPRAPGETHSFLVGVPELDLSVDKSLNIVSEPDDVTTVSAAMTLTNIGYGDLAWSIFARPRVSPAPSAAVTHEAPSVALVAAASINIGSELFTDPRDKLLATGRFSRVDIIDAHRVTPRVDELLDYDAVLVWSEAPFADAHRLGDNLADYVDAGGGVVLALYASVDRATNQIVRGRFLDDNYYCMGPFGAVLDGDHEWLGVEHEPDSPLLDGVEFFDGGWRSVRPAARLQAPGARAIADWGDGAPLIVEREINGVRRVDLGMYPPSDQVQDGGWNSASDGATIMANALKHVAQSISWLAATPTEGTLGTSESVSLGVHFDALDRLDGELLTGELVVVHSAGETTAVPASMLIDERLAIIHTPLDDTNDTVGPYLVRATVDAQDGVNAAAMGLRYSVDGGAFSTAGLTLSGADWVGEIPGRPMRSRVDYYIAAGDLAGRAKTDPARAPGRVHTFNVGLPELRLTVNQPLYDLRVSPESPLLIESALTITNVGAGSVTWRLRDRWDGSLHIAPDDARAPGGVHQGPDVGGYFMTDGRRPGGPTFDWIEATSAGVNLQMGADERRFPVPLPFPFEFYNHDFSDFALEANGVVHFQPGYLGYENQCIPCSIDGIGPLIALYWDNLFAQGAFNVYGLVSGAAPNRIVVLQWHEVPRRWIEGAPLTAQMQLRENDGDILFLYKNPCEEFGARATVGIQNDAVSGLPYLCNEASLTTGLAIQYKRGLSWLRAEPSIGYLDTGESIDIRVIVDADGLPHAFRQSGVVGLEASDQPDWRFVNASLRVIDGLRIDHVPYPGSNSESDPYEIVAGVESADDILSVDLVWSLDAGATCTTATMTTSDSASFQAAIPPQPWGSIVSYFIIAYDDAGRRTTHPASAPALFNAFAVGAPELIVDAPSLERRLMSDETNTHAAIQLFNAGPGALIWRLSDTSTNAWLSIAPASGSLATSATTALDVVFDPSEIPVGETRATDVVIEHSGFNADVTLPASLTVVTRAKMILDFLLGRRELDALRFVVADVNSDGVVDILDAVLATNAP